MELEMEVVMEMVGELEMEVSDNNRYLSFSVSLILLSITPSSSFQVVANSKISFSHMAVY